MLTLDMHVHTVVSKDSAIPVHPATVKAIARRGLDGIAITDHDTFANAGRMAALLRREGLLAIPGEEVRTPGGGEILCYFLTEPVKPGTWEEVTDAVRAQGGIAILAHPFDYIRGNWMDLFTVARRHELDALLRRVDGLETFNARNYSPGGNEMARARAAARGTIATAGSDAHNVFELGAACTTIDAPRGPVDDVLVAFKRGLPRPCTVETLPRLPLPLPLPGAGSPLCHEAWRSAWGTVKKACSGLNSALPAFKRWQAHRAAGTARGTGQPAARRTGA